MSPSTNCGASSSGDRYCAARGREDGVVVGRLAGAGRGGVWRRPEPRHRRARDGTESAPATEGIDTATTDAQTPGGDLDPKALLAAVRPAIALVTTPISQGSGVLVEGGYLVTNAHVVDPYGAATVDFEDEPPIGDVPVVGIDPYADIALLGPLEFERQPLPLAEAVELEQGDPLYLVGYPGEFDPAAAVTISSGLVSRLRDYAPFEQQYIQTDAAIGGGQSGGALVDGQGRVVGISGLSFAEQFALALSSPDVRRSIEAIASGDTPGYRPLVDQPTITSGDVEMFNELHQVVLLLNAADESRTLRLVIPESSSPTLAVSDLTGEFRWVNQPLMDQAVALDPSLSPTDVGDLLEPAEPDQYSVDIPAGADVMIVLGTTNSSGASVSFESNLPLVQYEDSDDPGTVDPGQPVLGVIDAFELEDGYEVDLDAGQTVRVRVSAGWGRSDLQLRATERRSERRRTGRRQRDRTLRPRR